MTREEIKDLALKEYNHHIPFYGDGWIDGFVHAFEWAESHSKFMENNRNLNLIDAIKGFCGLTDKQVYPVVSFMCRNEYIKDWECIDDSFYVDGKKISA